MATPSSAQDPLHPLTSALATHAPPLIYLCGKERFLVDRAIEAIKAAVLEPATKDFNYDQLFGKEAGSAQILACAKTLPMMAKRRLTLVRDADELTADELANLSKFIESPAPEACLCFVAEKADLRLRFFQLFKKHGLLLKLDPLAEKQLPSFIETEAKRLKVELSPGTAARLAEEIGPDLGQLADALERLCCYVPVGQPIRVSDVESVVVTTRQHSVFELIDAVGAIAVCVPAKDATVTIGDTITVNLSKGVDMVALPAVAVTPRQHSVFELIDAVGAADRAGALTLLTEMLMQREPALKLLALLSRHVMKLWQTADLLAAGRPSASEIASQLGVMPFVAGKLLDQARRLKLPRVQAMHEAIFVADRTLKQSKLDDERIMEQLILGLCST